MKYVIALLGLFSVAFAAPRGAYKTCTKADGCLKETRYHFQAIPKGSGKVMFFFHGHKGGAQVCEHFEGKTISNFVQNMHDTGYGWICPDSYDRDGKWWSDVNSSKNPDVVNTKAILKNEGYSGKQIYLTGHSNGGGFVSQFTTYGTTKIAGAFLAHSAAAGQNGRSELCDKEWRTPTFLSGSPRDRVIPWEAITRMHTCLLNKKVRTQLVNDAAEQSPESHHRFTDQSALLSKFWGAL